MSRFWRGETPELIFAALLTVTALGVDWLWVRPQEREMSRLLQRRAAVEKSASQADRNRLEAAALAEYVSGDVGGDTAWLEAYREADPLRMLERIREQARLRRLDLRLGERTEAPPFTRTTYFMSVQGASSSRFGSSRHWSWPRRWSSWTRSPWARGSDDPGVTLNLDVSVLTLKPEGKPLRPRPRSRSGAGPLAALLLLALGVYLVVRSLAAADAVLSPAVGPRVSTPGVEPSPAAEAKARDDALREVGTPPRDPFHLPSRAVASGSRTPAASAPDVPPEVRMILFDRVTPETQLHRKRPSPAACAWGSPSKDGRSRPSARARSL